MRIFITGATGFIGSHVMNEALTRGHKVVGLKRAHSSTPRVAIKDEAEWKTKSLDSLEKSDFNDIDLVIHLAAHSVHYPYDRPENCIYWNSIAPFKAMKAAHESGITKFIIAGSCFEYGTSAYRFDFIPADAPLEPTSCYAASKAMASTLFAQWSRENQLTTTIQRIFHVYGPGEAESRLWPSLQRAAMTGNDFPMSQGEQLRDFIAVEQVAHRIVNEAERIHDSSSSLTRIENVGTGKPQTVYDFSVKVWQSLEAKGRIVKGAIPYRDGEVMRYVPDLKPFDLRPY